MQSFERCLLVILVAAVLVNLFKTPPYYHTSVTESPQYLYGQSATKRASKLGDGCYHIYLDVGSNIGVHARFLYEPEKYPNAHTAHGIFNEQYGKNRNNNDFCVFAFEPNPAHVKRHKSLENYFQSKGWRYHYVQAAVSDSEGIMVFYHNDDANQEEWGFSDHALNKRAVPDVVPKIRFATWLMEEIYERTLPTMVHGDYGDIIGPRVVMKLDIESQEYAVLPDIMFSGIMCKTINFAFGEFHFWGVDYPPDNVTGRGGLHIEPREDGDEFMRNLLRAFHSVKDCITTEFRMADDEAYLHDGVPIPSNDTARL